MLTIKAEAIAGSSIQNTFEEATLIAKKLDCYVDFDFNGVHCTAHPGGDSKVGAERYFEAVKQDEKLFRYANNF